MSLYEIAIFNIYNQIRNQKISDQELIDLPEKIENDLKNYLSCQSPKKCFYHSLLREHFIFADFFLLQIEDKLDVINHGLRYAKNRTITEYLIRKGAIDFDYGLLGAIVNNDMKMIEYFIELGAGDFNNALQQAVIQNNLVLINYFIDLGANDFNSAIATATAFDNYDLIQFFLDQGADDFNEALVVAAWNGYEYLIRLYLNLGATDIILALGAAIDNDNFINILIPVTQPVQATLLGDALLYFVRYTNFFSKSGLVINDLLPYLYKGYADEESLKLLMKLYLLNQSLHVIDSDDSRKVIHLNRSSDHSSYYYAFGKIPSLYRIMRKKNRFNLINNNNGSTTFDNIKIYRPGFYPLYIDKLYFPNIIELNVQKNILVDEETEAQLWKEFIILKSIVNFYTL